MLNLIKLLLFAGLIVIFSCDKRRKVIKQAPVYLDFYKVSVNHIGQGNYDIVYKLALDSLKKFSDNQLDSFKDITDTKWELDSLICFNKLKDKCIMAFYVRYGEYVSNGVNHLYGVRVNDGWYFFRGPHLYIQSEVYGFKKNTPLPFSKLNEIAMDTIFKGYLKKSKEGKWKINDSFFLRLNQRDAYNFPFSTQKAWEESWLKLMRENWQRRDTINYKIQ